jgi:GNAT superfamily N-acetyltransferase
MRIKVRRARKSDSKEILKLINELADFEKLTPPDSKARKQLINDAFGKNPVFNVLLAKEGSKSVGYAFYFFTYSSFLAKKTLYLEDIFVSETYRKLGIGKMLMDELVKIARSHKCGRMEWCVLDWNFNAIRFYENLGAEHLKEWLYYRLSFEEKNDYI